jgi:transcription elongation factor Elf1
MKFETGSDGPSISIGGVKIDLKCPKCGGKRVSMEGGSITPAGMSGGTITCMDCGHSQPNEVRV